MRIERRIERLEHNAGVVGDCPRCSGIFIVEVNGKLDSASRNGVRMSEEEYRRYASELGPNGECPACGRAPGPTIRIGGLA